MNSVVKKTGATILTAAMIMSTNVPAFAANNVPSVAINTQENTENSQITRGAEWTLIGKENTTFTSNDANTITGVGLALSSSIGGAIGGMGFFLAPAAGGLTAAMPAYVLDKFLGKYIDCPMTVWLYEQVSWGQITYRIDWTINYNNQLYGPYSYYVPMTTYTSEEVKGIK